MTAVDATAETVPLSTAMREGSRAQHDDAESASFISELMGGKLTEAAYVNYLSALAPVYEALEETARSAATDPLIARLFDADLERHPSIVADIEAWRTGAPEEDLYEGRATRAYVDAIRATATNPVRLVAHLYTRYLGDLSGGLAIGRILDRDFSRNGSGLSFYEFASIAKPKVYKDDYRAALDALPLDEGQRAEVVAEVQAAFSHNQAVFAELGEHLDQFRR